MNWLIGDVVTSSKGNKTAPITDAKGQPIFLQLTTPREPLEAPFGASAYNDPTVVRKTYAFGAPQSLSKQSVQLTHT